MQVSDKKNLILDNAERLMLKDGYRGVSVDTIIANSGVSKGTFFYYFKTKDALAHALVLRFIERRSAAINALMNGVIAKCEDDFDILVDFLESFSSIRGEADNGCLLAAFSYQLMCELPELKKCCQQAITGWISFIQPYVERAFNAKSIHNAISASTFSKMLFCLMEGAYIVEKIQAQDEMDAQFKGLANMLRFLGRQHA